MWRAVKELFIPTRREQTEEFLCFVSSALSHLFLLLAALSIPPGLNWQAFEPTPRTFRSVTVSAELMDELEPVQIEKEERSVGFEFASLETGDLGDGKGTKADDGEGAATSAADDTAAGVQGDGRKYAMYCVGCADCDTNPHHPGCLDVSVEVVESELPPKEVNWEDIVTRALNACAGLSGGAFRIEASATGWVPSASPMAKCVASRLPIYQNNVSTPRRVQYIGGDEPSLEISW